jgi:hemerythrin-like metal-binding protein
MERLAMPQIEWDESFSVNHSEIDSQHKKWIDIHNRFCKILLEGDLDSQKKITTETLQSMVDFTRYHFKFEEEYLNSIGYPDIVKHARLHKDFDTLIYQYYREDLDGGFVLETELLKVIKNWLMNHILVEDKKYSQFASDHSQ